MRMKADNYFLKSFEEMGLIGKHFNVYNVCDDLIREDCYINDRGYACADSNELWSITIELLTGKYSYEIIQKKKKLRDWTLEDYKKWNDKHCILGCDCNKCIFNNVYCRIDSSRNWINHKDLYSDKFLNQEIEVEE